jgi:hypothetical protein
MHLKERNPKMVFRKASGKYPSNLMFGFEAELAIKGKHIHGGTLPDTLLEEMEKRSKKFYFFKTEYSVSNGFEVVTHPFDWNWIQKNKQVIDWFDRLNEEAKGARSCGFHVHISRKHFTPLHLKKMLQLYYFNPEFIKKVSKRENMGYCKPRISKEAIWGWDYKDHRAVTINDLLNVGRGKWSNIDKSCALNLYPKNTIEVRIFQGTSNKELIWAYLEFVKASVEFTRKVSFKRVNASNFKRYIEARKKEYPHACKLVRNPGSYKF